ncbi:aflatoxin B1 aldehyde reductase member 4-like [Actinia tenebrosa]|uniref:Aflatoxin B1 aldehyde reductase member 4-like n=1 Tax=Actinia tenebrosa TaxID=6105 RepID=A0A6P8GZ22_ACTTE|nr:aflatoxin B1 aldehyde reductase member 4-like [Actinia tenebrosa]
MYWIGRRNLSIMDGIRQLFSRCRPKSVAFLCTKTNGSEKSKPMKTALGTMDIGIQVGLAESTELIKSYIEREQFEIDTAYMYGEGKTEQILGQINLIRDPKVVLATKANPWSDKGLKYERVVEQMNTSLERLQRTNVDFFYLHAPDHKTPVEESLKAVDDLHKAGKFKEFGLSNYASWQVAEVYYLCKQNNYVLPTLYQGMYNPFTRDVEKELFPCLRRLGIRFYAYNPLAGGILTGMYKYNDQFQKQPQGRFFNESHWAPIYRSRYWKKPMFDNLDKIKKKLDEVYGTNRVSLTAASLRWMSYHSLMDAEHGDIIVLGGYLPKHVLENLQAVESAPLHKEVVMLFEDGWNQVKSECNSYFR